MRKQKIYLLVESVQKRYSDLPTGLQRTDQLHPHFLAIRNKIEKVLQYNRIGYLLYFAHTTVTRKNTLKISFIAHCDLNPHLSHAFL